MVPRSQAAVPAFRSQGKVIPTRRLSPMVVIQTRSADPAIRPRLQAPLQVPQVLQGNGPIHLHFRILQGAGHPSLEVGTSRRQVCHLQGLEHGQVQVLQAHCQQGGSSRLQPPFQAQPASRAEPLAPAVVDLEGQAQIAQDHVVSLQGDGPGVGESRAQVLPPDLEPVEPHPATKIAPAQGVCQKACRRRNISIHGEQAAGGIRQRMGEQCTEIQVAGGQDQVHEAAAGIGCCGPQGSGRKGKAQLQFRSRLSPLVQLPLQFQAVGQLHVQAQISQGPAAESRTIKFQPAPAVRVRQGSDEAQSPAALSLQTGDQGFQRQGGYFGLQLQAVAASRTVDSQISQGCVQLQAPDLGALTGVAHLQRSGAAHPPGPPLQAQPVQVGAHLQRVAVVEMAAPLQPATQRHRSAGFPVRRSGGTALEQDSVAIQAPLEAAGGVQGCPGQEGRALQTRAEEPVAVVQVKLQRPRAPSRVGHLLEIEPGRQFHRGGVEAAGRVHLSQHPALQPGREAAQLEGHEGAVEPFDFPLRHVRTQVQSGLILLEHQGGLEKTLPAQQQVQAQRTGGQGLEGQPLQLQLQLQGVRPGPSPHQNGVGGAP